MQMLVGADLARVAGAEVVLDEAQDDVLGEHLARQLVAEIGERPRLVALYEWSMRSRK